MRHVLAASRPGYEGLIPHLEKVTGDSFELITKREAFTKESLERLAPRYVFLPHWSYIIPEEIHESFECVIFHMTDLPYGRGGSPLQNLISRGIYETKLSALRCVTELDAGPIYLKRSLSLHGNAEEIFMRGAELVREMIIDIILTKPELKEQEGEPVVFARRKPEQSDISKLEELRQVYDSIRMLDAEGYPPAFVEVGALRFEFSRASFAAGDEIIADVRIRLRKADQ
jgi:methionyl-tRNA formyltransferase